MQGDKLCADELGQSFNQILLRGKVIVQSGDIHPGALGNGTRSQAFEPRFCDDIERRLQQRRAPFAMLVLWIQKWKPPFGG